MQAAACIPACSPVACFWRVNHEESLLSVWASCESLSVFHLKLYRDYCCHVLQLLCHSGGCQPTWCRNPSLFGCVQFAWLFFTWESNAHGMMYGGLGFRDDLRQVPSALVIQHTTNRIQLNHVLARCLQC